MTRSVPTSGHRAPSPVALAVGDAHRELIGRAVRGALLAAVLFFAFAYFAKEIPGVYAHTPWREDPYDAVVSFALFFVPLSAAACLVRVPLCRRYEPLPVQRARDLVRGCRVVLGCVLVTLMADWISVALREHRTDWTGVSALVVGLLAGASGVGVKVAVDLARASARRLPAVTQGTAGLDGLADLVALAVALCDLLGPLRSVGVRVVRWVDRRALCPIRRHPLAAAALVAVGFGAALGANVAIQEGGTAGWLLLFSGVAACGMYAFVVAAGAYLGWVSSERTPRGARRRRIDAAVVACASVPITLAFRDSLWGLVNTRAGVAGAGELAKLLLIAAPATFFLVLIAESCLKAHRPVSEAPRQESSRNS